MADFSVPSLGYIDLTKPLQYPVAYIAKPDRTIVAKLKDTLNITLQQKLSNTNQYQFDVPFTVYQNFKWVKNPVIDHIKERYLLKLVFGNINEWYVIEEINTQQADNTSNYGDALTVTCYLLNYELTSKMIFGFDALGINLETAMMGGQVTDSNGDVVQWNGVLSDSLWDLGYVDPSFNTTYLSFKEDKVTALDTVFKVAQAFSAVTIWDTENRQVSFYKEENVGMDRGFRLAYDETLVKNKFIQQYSRDSKTDQLYTRLWVYGSNGATINAANPTGSGYVEDYSFFMQGFEMDEQGNVTGHSAWMSDDLCKAITNYQNKLSSNNDTYSGLLTQLTQQQTQETSDSNVLTTLQTNLSIAQDLVDTMNAGSDYEITTLSFTASGNKTVTTNNDYNYAVMVKSTGSDTIQLDTNASVTLTANTWTVIGTIGSNTNVNPSPPQNEDGSTDPTINVSTHSIGVTLANSSDTVTAIVIMIDNDEYLSQITVQETQTAQTASGGVSVTLDHTPINVSSMQVVAPNGATIPSSAITVTGSTVTIASGNGVNVGDKVVVQYAYANNSNDSDIIAKYCVDWNQTQVNNQQAIVDADGQNITQTTQQISNLQQELSVDSNFTPAQITEWNPYIIETDYTNSNLSDPKELYDDAVLQLSMTNTPQVVYQIELANFLESIKQQRDWDKLALGDTVTIDYAYMGDNLVKAKMVEIDWDFENAQITLTIANTYDVRTGEYKFIDMLYQNTVSTSSLSSTSYKWDQAVSSTNAINEILNNTWDATAREITAGVKESVTINGRGITIREPNNPNNMLIAQAGVLALSNDGGQTWKQAIRADGIVAEQIYGSLLAGTNLQITTDNGSFSVDGTGVKIDGTQLQITGGITSENIDPTLVSSWNGKQSAIVQSANPPSSPVDQEMWLDTSTTPSIMYYYNLATTSWVQVGADASTGIPAQPTAPTSPATNSLWVDTSSVPNLMKLWDGTEWVNTAPTTASEITFASGQTLEAGSLQQGVQYNTVTIDGANGLVATRTDSLVRTIVNGTDGLVIQSYVSNAWENVLWSDTKGNLTVNGLTATDIMIQTSDATPVTLIDASSKTINFSGFNVIEGTINGSTNIANGSITGTQIQAGSITATQIATGSITATNGIISSINANTITTGSINANLITSGTISGVDVESVSGSNYVLLANGQLTLSSQIETSPGYYNTITQTVTGDSITFTSSTSGSASASIEYNPEDGSMQISAPTELYLSGGSSGNQIYFGSYSPSTSGYTALPNGFILQWKEFSQGTSASSYNWPITFPSAFLGGSISCSASTGQTARFDGTPSNSGFIAITSYSTLTTFVMGVGY